MNLIHMSDSHIFTTKGLRPSQLMNKRILGLLSWVFKRGREFNPDILPRLQQDKHVNQTEVILFTGDLTHLGRREEFKKATGMLLNPATPGRYCIIPGNHDYYVAEAESTMNQGLSRFNGSWDTRRYEDDGKGFPKVRILKDLAIIGLSSAVSTSWHLATGILGQEQLNRLDTILEHTGRQGLFQIVMVHHPPLPGLVSQRKALLDQRPLMSLLKKRGCHMILFGHTHRRYLNQIETARGLALVLGAPSCCSVSLDPWRRAGFFNIQIEKEKGGWRLQLTDLMLSRDMDDFEPFHAAELKIANN